MGVCFLFLYPTVRWYFFVPKEDQAMALGTREQIRDYARRTAGQDLERLAAAARRGEALPAGLEFLANEAKKHHRGASPQTWDAAAVSRSFPRLDVLRFIETRYADKFLNLKRLHQSAVQLGLDLSGGLSIVLQGDMEELAETFRERYERAITDQERDVFFEQTLEILNGRVDRFGLTEPVIRRQGADQIYIEIPGSDDPERIRNIIMESGGLSFRLHDPEASQAFYEYQQAHPGIVPNPDGTLPVQGVVPDDVLVFGVYKKDRYGLDEFTGYAAVKKEVALDGSHIQHVAAERDPQSNELGVSFILDSQGGDIFFEFTSANIGKPLAIVMDNKIRTIATINQAIRNQVRISGNYSQEDANNMAAVLRSAALPVRLDIVSHQSIGPSLGADTIRRGLYALLGGIAMVLAFMVLYYRSAGFNAVVAQVLNIYLMFSILSAFNLTLTLPSIAGFILTVGMATDANVVIFERMKEELRLGKSRRASIDAGFDKAFWAVMDSNITTLIAALFLSQLGSGPIQGFAVSLSIGIFSSVFTALFVSRLMFDFSTDVLKTKKLRVSWFIKQNMEALDNRFPAESRTGRA
jgi:preprotein translocase subunit SecD